MTISEKIVESVNNSVRSCGTMTAMSRRELFLLVSETYDINYNSFLPQDYCYNRTNMGIKFTEHAHVLEYIDADCYRLLGANYPYVILPCNSTTYTAWLTEHISFSSILPPLVKI